MLTESEQQDLKDFRDIEFNLMFDCLPREYYESYIETQQFQHHNIEQWVMTMLAKLYNRRSRWQYNHADPFGIGRVVG